jgi:ankyrin repeat protein
LELASLGLHVIVPTNEGRTPLYIAAHQGHMEVVQALKAPGAKW